jgi:predicted Zn-dependent protease
MALRHFLIPLLLTALLAAAVGCAVNPVTGDHQLALMSEDQEIAAGRENDPKVKNQYGIYDDALLQAYVQQIGERLAAQSHRPGLIYRFTVLDSADVNAFALPGGYIYITRGILAYLNSEAELAAVLGHEIGHVTARHSVRQYSAAMAANIGATIASIFVPELGNQGGQQLLNVLGGALLSGYGRDHELEADRLGAQYIARTGFESNAMIEVVALLKNQEEFEKERAKSEGREPRIYHGVFASHPSADTRLQQVVGEARKHLTGGTARTNRDEFLRRIDGLTFGDSPKEGIRRGNSFYHRDLNFALRFPDGWRLENNPKSLNARNTDNTALISVSVEDLNRRIMPREFMLQRLKLGELTREGPLEGVRLPTHSAVANISTPYGKRETRVSVVFYNNRAFVFYGTTKSTVEFNNFDRLFQQTAASLHALTPDEKRLANGLHIGVVRVERGDGFTKLGQRSPIGTYAESVLRLINDKYPSGELTVGEKIKVIR